MTIAEMHWEFDFRYNKINSNAKKQLTPQTINYTIDKNNT